MAKFCSKCGAKIEDTESFCPQCGAPVGKTVKDKNWTKPGASSQIRCGSSSGDNKKTLILVGALCIAVVLGAGIFGYMKYVRAPQEAAQQTEVSTPSQANTPAQPSPTEVSAARLQEYTQKKNQFDEKIIAFSNRINQHLSSYAGFAGTNYDVEADTLSQDIQQARSQLDSDTAVMDQAQKTKLLKLYDLELVRIRSMREGIMASKRGEDFSPYFQRGTAAAYEFDSVNK